MMGDKVIQTKKIAEMMLKPKRTFHASTLRDRRQKWYRRLQRTLIHVWVQSLLGRTFWVDYKWRWNRGEIRERRLYFNRMVAHVRGVVSKHRDYVGIGRKAFIVEPLNDPPGLKTYE